jgi:hypothetical protein
MRLYLDTLPALLNRLPDLTADRMRERGGRKHVEHRQRALTALMEGSYTGLHLQHRTYPDADAFTGRYLQKRLKTNTANGTTASLLRPFYAFPEGNRGYRAGKTAKAYRLDYEAANAVEDVLSGDEPLSGLVESDNYTDRLRFEDLPENGIPRPVGDALFVPKVLPLTPHAVERAQWKVHDRMCREGKYAPLNPAKGERSFPLERAWRRLQTCRHWVVSYGGLPNVYREESTGRLGPVGLHVIGLPKELRRLLLAGSGLVDFDLAACNWSIVQSVAGALSLPTPVIDGYRADRQRWHDRWATLTKGTVPAAAFKAVTLSWLTGGQLSEYHGAAADTIGPEGVRVLRDDPDARRLKEEARAVMKKITARALTAVSDGKETVYLNAVGAVLRPGKGQKGALQKCSHVLTGFEQFAIRRVCREVRSLRAIVFDGFIAPDQDHSGWSGLIERESYEALGIPLRLHLEKSSF